MDGKTQSRRARDHREPREVGGGEQTYGLTSIQDHGALLAVTGEDLRVVHESANAASFLGVDAPSLLGVKFADLLEGPSGAELAEAVAAGGEELYNPLILRLATPPGRAVSCVVHRSETVVVLEFEALDPDSLQSIVSGAVAPLFELVNGLLRESEGCGTLSQLADLVARRARHFTGFDRVLVYAFHDDGHGEVVGESSTEGMEPFLGLHYPATDISRRARELYRYDRVHLIADVDAPGVSLATFADWPGGALDLTRSVLRCHSPNHLQYLSTMGVQASMSVSLIHDDELWGLILFHHRAVRFLPYAARAACELLGSVVAPQMAQHEREFERLQQQERREAVDGALGHLVRSNFAEDIIDEVMVVLCQAFQAAGVCLRRGEVEHRFGNVPRAEVRRELVYAVYDQGVDRSFVAEDLREFVRERQLEWGEGGAAGLASALVIAAFEDMSIAFFREPRVETIRWARDPSVVAGSATQVHQPGGQGSPTEKRSGQALAWSANDLVLGAHLRTTLLSTMLLELEAIEDRLVVRMESVTRGALKHGRLHALVEIGEIGFWEFDIAKREVTDQHWSRMLGFEPGDIEPSMEGFRAVCHPDDVDRVIETFDDFLESEELCYRDRFRMVRKDGGIVRVESRGQVMHRDAEGHPLRILGMQYPLDSDAGSEEVRHRSRELESIIHAISHDLKSPLVTCRGFVGLAREGLDAGDIEGAKVDLSRVDKAAERMGRIIDDLLVMSRIGRVGFVKEPLDLAELFREAAEVLAPRAKARGATIEFDTSAPLVLGDRPSISRALENLVANALQYGCVEPGGKVEIGVERGTSELRIFVRDDGPGIDARFHKRIFKLFARLEGDESGTGVGLASVERVAQVHGGRAWVESSPGEGATFWISLPARESLARIREGESK
ncbi:ATP-binding protein [Engelhardtia mirabilis]|uniref:histidine kinase n=1 Tax=Engelhardtia mirabilis TaxID=2528011 RepID=A0A518BQX8_9BACT|nr:Phytochrome-like protein cph1 [Planctomycetes bacterium Pla133]